ncbi:hypothetical protein BHYA_0418g00030 [Botrytis hyacinthi]|uniref:Uncharacterized protein n=1 Tax=Botrytis hyacinthi TaxID=278943 RepID=A0A4Z1G8H1_9HELO|nr:hypothetical protein BHYA_0418g00030 [Botrytis hyacinthi]
MSTSQSQHHIDDAETLAKKIRGTEIEISRHKLGADKKEKLKWLSYEITKELCSHAESPKHFKLRRVDERSLILIPTREDDDSNAIWKPFKSSIGSCGYTAVALRMKLKDTQELSRQSYGLEAAMEKCSIQIKNMLSENEESIKHFAKIHNVHSVYVGAIQSYIELQPGVHGKDRLVEYNFAVYSNALNPYTSVTASSISHGVTVPTRFSETDRSFENFRHREFKDLDWYEVVLDNGTTRCKILRACASVLLDTHWDTLFKFYDERLWDCYPKTKKSEIWEADSGHRPRFIESTKDEVNSATTDSTTSDSTTTRSEISKTAAPSPKKTTKDTSNSAKPKTATSRSDRHRAVSPNAKKPTSDGSKAAVPKVATTKAVTPKAAISIPVKPKLATHRSDISDRSKAPPSDTDESASDITPLIKHRSYKPKAALSKPVRSGKETIKAATRKLDESLHKLDPRKPNSRQHRGYNRLEES